ncbi:LytR/AlgR family response regulator transcription factor [Ekhidna sp.]|uniref:LytR/AlgR family response regulator transcription factor n=1 Tax=Ekhidna sp. TaxID=2608089 RepID=UPI003B5A73B5
MTTTMQVLKTETPNIKDRIDQFEGSIFLNVGKQIQRISLKSIEYIKGYGDYMKVKCKEKSHTVHITMKNLQKVLPSSDFYRVHKSYIIRLDKIDHLSSSHVQINDTHIPISRNNKQELLSLIPWVK